MKKKTERIGNAVISRTVSFQEYSYDE